MKTREEIFHDYLAGVRQDISQWERQEIRDRIVSYGIALVMVVTAILAILH